MLKAAVARVQADGGPQGTGFLVRQTHLVTCAHVLGRDPDSLAERATLTFADGRTVGASRVWVHERLDLAVLALDHPAPVAPLLRGEVPERGAAWESWGFPDQVDHGHPFTGKVSDPALDIGPVRTLLLETGAARERLSGVSGAPLVVSGRVVGVITWQLTRDGKPSLDALYALPIAALEGSPTVPLLPVSPYPGLRAFESADAAVFFGREEQSERLAGQVRAVMEDPADAPRMVVLYGPSGCGKTSLLRAGVIPRLGEETEVVLFQARADLTWQLALAMAEGSPMQEVQALRDELDRDAGGLTRALQAVPELAGRHVLICIDALEQVHAQDAGEAFLDLLLHAASHPEARCTVVVTLRSEFLGWLQGRADTNLALAQHGTLVSAMTREQLTAAVARPALEAGRPLDAGVVHRLVDEALGRQGALPALQYALARVWDGLGRGEPAARVMEAMGWLGGALATQAEEVYDNLPEGEQGRARFLFSMLATRRATSDPWVRRSMPVDELVKDAETRAVLDRFAAPGVNLLVTFDPDGPGPRPMHVEVAHESLFSSWDRLGGWLEEVGEWLIFRDKAELAASEWRQGDGQLWREARLQRLRWLVHVGGYPVSDDVRAFLDESFQVQARTDRLRLAFFAALLFALIIAMGSAVWALDERDRAEDFAAVNLPLTNLVLYDLVVAGMGEEELEALDDALAAMHASLEAKPDRDAEEERMRGMVRRAQGQIQVERGEPEEALNAFREAQAIASRQAEQAPANPLYLQDQIVYLERQGDVAAELNRWSEALQLYEDELLAAKRAAELEREQGGSLWVQRVRRQHLAAQRVAQAAGSMGQLTRAHETALWDLSLCREALVRGVEQGLAPPMLDHLARWLQAAEVQVHAHLAAQEDWRTLHDFVAQSKRWWRTNDSVTGADLGWMGPFSRGVTQAQIRAMLNRGDANGAAASAARGPWRSGSEAYGADLLESEAQLIYGRTHESRVIALELLKEGPSDDWPSMAFQRVLAAELDMAQGAQACTRHSFIRSDDSSGKLLVGRHWCLIPTLHGDLAPLQLDTQAPADANPGAARNLLARLPEMATERLAPSEARRLVIGYAVNLATLDLYENTPDTALTGFTDALTQIDSAGELAPLIEWRKIKATALEGRGAALTALDRPEQALAAHREALALREGILADQLGWIHNQLDLAASQARLAQVVGGEEGRALVDQALVTVRDLASRDRLPPRYANWPTELSALSQRL